MEHQNKKIARKTMPSFGGVKRSVAEWEEFYFEELADKEALYAEIARLRKKLRVVKRRLHRARQENQILKERNEYMEMPFFDIE